MSALVTILIVEDEEDSRESLREWLELEGYRVACAANGQEALDWLDTHGEERCVMVLDLFMPVLDGWQVYERLRSRGKLPTLEVLVTTSAPHKAPAGATVLAKPLDLDELLEAVRAAFSAASSGALRSATGQ
jgi:CheY-like chemotaxis protein